jgi:lantibiotic modifying enzyme
VDASTSALPRLSCQKRGCRELPSRAYSGDAHGFGHNHSVCHGDFGALALFDLAARTGFDTGRHDAAAAAVTADIAANGARCGLVGDIHMPGLMLGAAGICLSLLRIARPAQVPAVAWLQPPLT